MTEQVLISMTSDELRYLMAQAVEQGLNRAKVKKVLLRPMEAARALWCLSTPTKRCWS